MLVQGPSVRHPASNFVPSDRSAQRARGFTSRQDSLVVQEPTRTSAALIVNTNGSVMRFFLVRSQNQGLSDEVHAC